LSVHGLLGQSGLDHLVVSVDLARDRGPHRDVIQFAVQPPGVDPALARAGQPPAAARLVGVDRIRQIGELVLSNQSDPKLSINRSKAPSRLRAIERRASWQQVQSLAKNSCETSREIMSNKALVLQLPQVVRDLWNAQQALVRHYATTGLRFTLDGRLVGDIAEAVALEHFDLVLPKKRTGGVDALTKAGKTVQVKATGKAKSGPAFTPGEGFAHYLLFLRIDFETNSVSIAYNGPEAPIRALLPKAGWAGTKVLALADIQRFANAVKIEEALSHKLTAQIVNRQPCRQCLLLTVWRRTCLGPPTTSQPRRLTALRTLDPVVFSSATS
jgi:hypothetical protein